MLPQVCSTVAANPILSDFSTLQTDQRLIRRVQQIAGKWRESPALGFSEVFGDEAGLEGAYRLFGNPRIDFKTLLAPHVRGTLKRAGPGVFLSLEDTTAFSFSGEKKREGLGRIVKNDQGFLGHCACLVSADGLRTPLGVAAIETWIRSNKKEAQGKKKGKAPEKERESARWGRMVEHVEGLLLKGQQVIHVQDREGDIYSSVASMYSNDRRFVVRAIQNRSIEENERGDRNIYEALEGLPVMGTMCVEVSARPGSSLPDRRKSHPPRKARTATVAITATSVTLKAPERSSPDSPKTAKVNLVHVFEPSPPKGEEPIEWMLLTTESISTLENVQTVIDIYATRWMIEEFFKAIKTGCAYEKRQLETYHALKNALAVCIPIAWEMLALRSIERTAPDTPASEILSPKRLEVLKATAERYPLPEEPTIKDALFAIAGMGGFLKRNGRPGWLTLRRGYVNLLSYERVWLKAKERFVESGMMQS